MEEENVPTEGKAGLGIRIVQWIVFAVVAFFLLIFATPTKESISAPGAPVVFYWTAIAIFAAVVVALAPPVFSRMPRQLKVAAYVALLPAFITATMALIQVGDAFELTPAGAAQKAERDAEAAAQAEADQRAQAADQQLAELEALDTQLNEIAEQQEACLSWGGQLSDLNDRLRERLHNPDSFEHVETRFIVPQEDRMNVIVVFRAESGFGALRTAGVKARMVPETCEIVSIGEPEDL